MNWGPFFVFHLWKVCRDVTRSPKGDFADPKKLVPKMRVVAAWFYFWLIVLPIAAFVRTLFVAAGDEVSIGTRVGIVLVGYFFSMMVLPLLGFILVGKTWPLLARLLGVEVKE